MFTQVDGADTVSETDNSEQDESSSISNFSSIHRIPVVTNLTRAPRHKLRDAPQVLRTINRNPRINSSSELPVVAVANVRSLLPKMNSFIEKFENEEIEVCLISEVWEKQGKKNQHFQARVEETMELKGFKYISCGARPSGKRGGGAAILADMRKFTMEKLDINVPNNLEVQWAMVRPKQVLPSTKYREMIFCSFYSPPRSRKHRVLLDHLVSATHALMARYPGAAVYLGGDKNSMPLAPLLLALPRYSQVVSHCTHGVKIIDVLIMSCPELYAVPDITAPVLPDDPRHAAPSDHKVPVARPLACASVAVTNVYEERTYRPLPDSGRREFMRWVHSDVWESIPDEGSTTEQFREYERLVHAKVEELLPEKKVRVTKKDKEFITSELKTLDRRKKREWRKKGKSEKYLRLKKIFTEKYKKAASQFIAKCVSELKQEQPGKAAATLKRLGAQPGDCQEGGTFTLLNHIQENLTIEEQLERFGQFFSSFQPRVPSPETRPVV